MDKCTSTFSKLKLLIFIVTAMCSSFVFFTQNQPYKLLIALSAFERIVSSMLYNFVALAVGVVDKFSFAIMALVLFDTQMIFRVFSEIRLTAELFVTCHAFEWPVRLLHVVLFSVMLQHPVRPVFL
jgi:hypothetical protein